MPAAFLRAAMLRPRAVRAILNAGGLRQLAFAVPDVAAAAAWLAQRGIACAPIRTDPLTGGRMTFFFDPDGLPLELHS